jgi:hypothetical protein
LVFQHGGNEASATTPLKNDLRAMTMTSSEASPIPKYVLKVKGGGTPRFVGRKLVVALNEEVPQRCIHRWRKRMALASAWHVQISSNVLSINGSKSF